MASSSCKRILPLAISLLLMACASGGGGTQSTYVGEQNTPPKPAEDIQTKPDTVSQPDIASPDIVEEPVDERLPLACGSNYESGTDLGEAPMGAPCSEHSECSTGFCYQVVDGGYMGWAGGFSFCSIACGGCSSGAGYQCSDFDTEDGPKFKCLKFTNSCFDDEHPVRQFCAPACQGSNGMMNCEEWYPGQYTACELPSIGDCGTIGASKVCIVPDPK